MTVPVNYILVDLENVVPEDFSLLDNDCFRVKIFVGANQTKLPTNLVTAVQRLGEKAEYVEISGSGKNALDFHIAFFLGKYSQEEPRSFFHIISKDTGYDPLVTFCKARKIHAARWENIRNLLLCARQAMVAEPQQESVPAKVVAVSSVAPSTAPACPEKGMDCGEPCWESLCEKLKKMGTAAPQKREALVNHLASSLPKTLSRSKVEEVAAKLFQAGIVNVKDGKLVYDFSEKKLVAMRKSAGWLKVVKEKIAQDHATKPRSRAALLNSIKGFCQNKLSDQEVEKLLEQLFQEGYVRENGSKLVYVFEPVPAVPVPIPAPAEKTMEKSAVGCNFVPIQCEEKPQQSWMSLMFGKGK
ncbi:MAG: PIN domain-containing protein [Lentisphaeria bacterium]|nr:PIN domain-containing protein [Lentisphaeria bacterium]